MTIAVLFFAALTLWVLISWGLEGCAHRYVVADAMSFGDHRTVSYCCEKCGARLGGTM